MVYLITVPNHILFRNNLTFQRIYTPFPLVGTRNFPKISQFGYGKVIKSSSWTCFCKGDWERERGLELKLEAEILEFMKGSEKPGAFPTKAELVEAGRRDLAEAIVKRGGWLSMGWDLEEEEMEMEGVGDQRDKSEENAEMGNDYCEVMKNFDESVERFGEGSSSASIGFSHGPSISGRSFETRDGEEDSGVEGILTRLEKERNLSFGTNMGREPLSRNDYDDWLIEASGDVDSDHLRRSRRFSSGSSSEGILTGGKFSRSKSISEVDGSWSSLKPEMVKTWTIQRASFSSSEYEGAICATSEVSSCDRQFHEAEDDPKDRIIAVSEGSSEALDEKGDNSHIDLRTRLQHLELQLASTLCSLRSKSERLNPKEGYEPFTEMQKLSDALEFQETEIMNAKDNLRSIRAKLAILEGKMTLAIIDARKTIDEKQRKIDGAHRALQLLRTTSIVWPNSASEVLLVGSFDGWTTQRRMMKSSSGIFSIDLKLYPGKYEIKFIVDGAWKVDPLRPIVKNGGYENNLFIVT